MGYRFVRMIGSGLAEVTNPQGRTVRIPVPSGSNFRSGQEVTPTFDKCCQPTGLVLPTPSSNQLKPFKDVLQPRRVNRVANMVNSLVWFVNKTLVNTPEEKPYSGLEVVLEETDSWSKVLEATKNMVITPIVYSRPLPYNLIPLTKVGFLQFDQDRFLGDVSPYLLLGNDASRGLIGVYRSSDNSLELETLTPNNVPGFPIIDFISGDLEGLIMSQSPTTKLGEVYLLSFNWSRTNIITTARGSTTTTAVTLDPLSGRRAVRGVGSETTTTKYINPFDINTTRNMRRYCEGEQVIKTHQLVTGFRLVGERVVQRTVNQARYPTTTTPFPPEYEKNTTNTTYPSLEFKEALNLILGNYNSVLWVSFDVTAVTVFYKGVDLLAEEPLSELINSSEFSGEFNPDVNTTLGTSTLVLDTVVKPVLMDITDKIYVV